MVCLYCGLCGALVEPPQSRCAVSHTTGVIVRHEYADGDHAPAAALRHVQGRYGRHRNRATPAASHRRERRQSGA
jgi:hypothetical protein